MKNVQTKIVIYSLSAAFIWGMAFAFQRSASVYIEAFTFNFYRCVLAVLSLYESIYHGDPCYFAVR